MSELEELQRLLEEAIEEAQRVQQSCAHAWSPGCRRVLKDALVLLQRSAAKVELLPGDSVSHRSETSRRPNRHTAESAPGFTSGSDL